MTKTRRTGHFVGEIVVSAWYWVHRIMAYMASWGGGPLGILVKPSPPPSSSDVKSSLTGNDSLSFLFFVPSISFFLFTLSIFFLFIHFLFIYFFHILWTYFQFPLTFTLSHFIHTRKTISLNFLNLIYL